MRIFVIALAVAAAAGLAGGCASGPMSGGALERLKADLAEVRPGPIAVTAIGPRALAAGGAGASVVMPFVSHGSKVAEFPLYDGFFKTGFVLVDELRSLGLAATLSPSLWAGRAEAVAFDTRELKDDVVETNLIRLGAQKEVGQIWRLEPHERRQMLVSLLVLIAARSALPLEMRAAPAKDAPPGKAGAAPRKEATAREIRERFFAGAQALPPRLTLECDALELSARSEEGTFGGSRHGRARLLFRLAADGRRILEREVSCEADADGTGVAFEKLGASYSFTLAEDDPLAAAIRGCLRAFMVEAVPALRYNPRS